MSSFGRTVRTGWLRAHGWAGGGWGGWRALPCAHGCAHGGEVGWKEGPGHAHAGEEGTAAAMRASAQARALRSGEGAPRVKRVVHARPRLGL